MLVHLIHFTTVLSITLLVLGGRYASKNNQKLVLYAAIVGALVLEAGTRLFLVSNLGRNEALQRFDYLGLTIVMLTTLLIGLIAGVAWFRRKGFGTPGLLTIMALIQLLLGAMMYGGVLSASNTDTTL